MRKFILAIVLGAATVAPALASGAGYYWVSDYGTSTYGQPWYSLDMCERTVPNGYHCEYRSS